MMVERHYDDEALLTLMEGKTRADAHLTSCPACAEKLDTFRTITDVLNEHDLWDQAPARTEPVPATIANLRAFADRMSFEDTAADAILPQLLAGPREEWMPRLMAHPEWRTGGVVRKLVEASNRAIDTLPPDAVELTALATEIADHLTAYPADTIHRLSGVAWRERAYAYFYCGMAGQALLAVERAEAEFSHCTVGEYEIARVGVVKALTLRLLEQFSTAAAVAADSAASFVRFADLPRVASARLAQVHLLFSSGDFAAAEPILVHLDRLLANSEHAETHARVLINRGYCSWHLGKIDEALGAYELAGALFETLDIQTESVRVRWNATLMLAEAGRLSDACTRLERLTADMEQLGMASEAALNALHIAEHLLAEDRHDEVERLCRSAIRVFEQAGLGYTTRALTALAYLREAAQHRVVTPVLVRSVREYIRELPSRPNLIYAPPPD